MKKKIEIAGIQLDDYNVRDSMALLESFLDNTVMNIVETVSMDMLLKAGADETVRERIERLDLAIINEKEILEAAGVVSAQRVREIKEHQFYFQFLNRIVRSKYTVYLFGSSAEKLLELQEYLKEKYENIRICGSFALNDCVGDIDGAVNEINIASPDIILSILSTPEQEYFLAENQNRMNAKVWFGLGESFESYEKDGGMKRIARKLVRISRLRRMLARYNREN